MMAMVSDDDESSHHHGSSPTRNQQQVDGTGISMRHDNGGDDHHAADDDEQQLLVSGGSDSPHSQPQQLSQQQIVDSSSPVSPRRRLLATLSMTSLHSKSLDSNEHPNHPKSPHRSHPRRRRSLLGTISATLQSASSTLDAVYTATTTTTTTTTTTRYSSHENEREHDDDHADNSENYHEEQQKQILQEYCQQEQSAGAAAGDDDDMQDAPPSPAFFAPPLQVDVSTAAAPAPAFVDGSIEQAIPAEAAAATTLPLSSPTKQRQQPIVRRRSLFFNTLTSSINGATATAAVPATPDENHRNDETPEEETVLAAVPPPRPARRRSIFGGATALLLMPSSSSTHGTTLATFVAPPPRNNIADADVRQDELVPAVAVAPPRPTRRRSMFGGAGLLSLSSTHGTSTVAASSNNNRESDDIQDESVPEAVASAPPRPARRRSIFGGTSLLMPSSIYGGTAAVTPNDTTSDDNDEKQEESVPAEAAPQQRPARRRSIFGGTSLLPSLMVGTLSNADVGKQDEEPVAAVAPPRPARRRSIFGGGGAALLSSSIHGTNNNNDNELTESPGPAATGPQRPARRRSIFGGMTTVFNRGTTAVASNEKEEVDNNDAAVAPITTTDDNVENNGQEQEPQEEDYPFIYIVKPASCSRSDELDNTPKHPALLPKPAKGRFRNTMKRERSNRKLGDSNRSNKISEQSSRSLCEDVSALRETNHRSNTAESSTRMTENDNLAGGSSDELNRQHQHCPITDKVLDPPEPSAPSIPAPPLNHVKRVRKAILKSLTFRPWKRKLLKDDADGDADDSKANGKQRKSMIRRSRSSHHSSKSLEPQSQEQLSLPTARTSPILECQDTAQQQLMHENAKVQGGEGEDDKSLDCPSFEDDTMDCFNRSFDGLESCIDDDDDDGCFGTASLFGDEAEKESTFNPLELYCDDDGLDSASYDEETVEKSVTTLEEAYEEETVEVLEEKNEKSVTTLEEEYEEETVEVLEEKSASYIEYEEETIGEFEKSLKTLEYEEEELVDFDQEDVFVVSPHGRIRDREGRVFAFNEDGKRVPSSLQPPPLDSHTLPSPALSQHLRSDLSTMGQDPVAQVDQSSGAGTSISLHGDNNDAGTQEVITDESEPHLQYEPSDIVCISPDTKFVLNEQVNNVNIRENESVNEGEKPLLAPPSPSLTRKIFGSEKISSPEQSLLHSSKPEMLSDEQALQCNAIAPPSPGNMANMFNEIFRGLKALSPRREGKISSPTPCTHSEIELRLNSLTDQYEFQSDDEPPPSPTNEANTFHEIFRGLMMPSHIQEEVDGSTAQLHRDESVTLPLPALPLSSLVEMQNEPSRDSQSVAIKFRKTQGKSLSSGKRMPSPPRRRKTDKRPGGRRRSRGRQSGTRAVGDPMRWDLRVRFGSPVLEVYNKTLRHDDCVLVPDFFGPTSDWSMYYKLLVEIRQLQDQNVKGSNLIECPPDVGKHLVCPTPMKCKTFKEACKKVCRYFDIKLDTVQFTLCWYRDNTDIQQPRHDEEAYENEEPSIRNITVGISFGAERELSLEKHKDADVSKVGARISIPQGNNSVCTIGRDVNIRFKNSLVQTQNLAGGTIAITIWGQVQNAKEQGGSPPQLKRDQAIT